MSSQSAYTERVGAVHKSFHAGQLDEARTSVDALLGEFGDRLSLMLISARIAEASHDWSAAREIYQRATERHPQRPEPWLKMAETRIRHKKFSEAEQALEQAEACDADPLDVFVIHKRLQAKLGRAPTESARNKLLAGLRKRLDEGPPDAAFSRAALEAPLPADLSNPILEWAKDNEDSADVKRRTLAVRIVARLGRVGDEPSDAMLRRPIVEPWGDRDVVIARTENPSALVFVFTGIRFGVMMDLQVFDRYLAAKNVTAVYLRDLDRLVFGNGLSSVDDGFPETVAYLRRIAEEVGAPRIAAIGSSAGGLAAIRYGLALDCEVALCFGTTTNMSADFMSDDGRGKMIIRRMQDLPNDALDMRPQLEASGARMPVHLVYGMENPQDVKHAEHLRNVPGVVFHPLEGVALHTIADVLASQGQLMPLIETVLLGEEERIQSVG